MARNNNDRKVHFFYNQHFLNLWGWLDKNSQNFCDAVGSYYGYTGQNVFYTLLPQFLHYHKTGNMLPARHIGNQGETNVVLPHYREFQRFFPD